MLTKEQIIDVLKKADVLQEGHFLLTSGRHSDKYMQCAKIFKHANYTEMLCRDLAEKFKDDDIQLVIGPAIGAITMAYEVSRHLQVENIFAERENGAMCLRRGFMIKPGQRVLVVEDVITTGGTVREVINIVKQAGGVVAGVGSIVDRTNGQIDFGTKYEAVIQVDVQSYTQEECPICKQGIPLVKPGSRKV